MNLINILDESLVIVDLKATTKEEVVKQLVHAIVMNKDRVPTSKVLEDAIWDRERNGSTAVGNGISFPHARIEGLRDIFIAIGVSKSGIAVDAPDRKKVQLFFLILCPHTKNLLLLQTLAALSAFLKVSANRKALCEAKKAKEVISIIKKADVRIKKELQAGDFMNKNITSVSPEMNLKEVVGLFFKKGIDSAPVLGPGDKLIGDLTGKGLLCVGLPSYANLLGNIAYLSDFEPFEDFFKKQDKIKVRNLLSPMVVKVKETTPLIEVAFKMVKEDIRRVYVVDTNDKLLGVIYRRDIIGRVFYS
ncbi:MAG: PTS sugar transporter subunit IIA [Candidatus Ancaeobacter aquaticus]|nr:PTS sugar transporter subunit IIA [Candidatus Ancaeobacter aquaticus]